MNEELFDNWKEVKEKYENAQFELEQISQILKNHIFSIASRVDDFRNKKREHFYQEFDIENDKVLCKWYDTWAYGGEDWGTTIFPENLLYSENRVLDYINQLNKKEEEENEIYRLNRIKDLQSQLDSLNKVNNIL